MTAEQPSPWLAGAIRRVPGAAQREGLTLAELVFVVIVVGVLTTLVVPQLNVTPYLMDGQVRGSVAALVAAQRTAVKAQHDVVVAFDTANRRLRVHADRDNDGVLDPGEHARWVQLHDNIRFSLGDAPEYTPLGSQPLSFSATQDGMPALTFRRNGSTTEQGGFYLTSRRATANTQSRPSDSRAVEIERATGRTSWLRYEPPNWEKGF